MSHDARERGRARTRRSTHGAWLFLLALVIPAGCASGPRAAVTSALERHDLEGALRAYDDVAQVDGDDDGLLAHVAALVLEEAAESDDHAIARAAIGQLSMAGTAGRPALERLSRAPGDAGIRALVALAERGHRDARRVLRGYVDSPDPTLRAAALVAVTPEDRAITIAASDDVDAAVRRAALARLAALAPDGDARAVLEGHARHDAEDEVRATAVRALASFGAVDSVLLVLTERLSDPASMVRDAALEALVRTDRDRARAVLLPWLALPTSGASIDAARLLATPFGTPASDDDRDAARRYLLAALEHADPTLRDRAAIALVALPDDAPAVDAVLARVPTEPDPHVRLSLLRVVERHDGGRAREGLAELARSTEGMSGLQAALLAARLGDGDSLARVRRELTSSEPRLRRVAARGLARELERPSEVAPLLRDEDAEVRVHAAGGILAISAMRDAP